MDFDSCATPTDCNIFGARANEHGESGHGFDASVSGATDCGFSMQRSCEEFCEHQPESQSINLKFRFGTLSASPNVDPAAGIGQNEVATAQRHGSGGDDADSTRRMG